MLTLGGSLALPAAEMTAEPNHPTHVFSGNFALMTSQPYYLSNALLLLGPLVAWLMCQRREPGAQRALTWLYLASLLFVAAAPIVLRDSRSVELTPAAGCYLWLASHALMTLALSLPVWGAAEARRHAEQELQLLHDKWVRGADPHGEPAGIGLDSEEAVDPFVDGPTI